MIVRYGAWKSHDFDASKSQILKYGVYVPYGNDQWVVLDEYIFWSHRIQKAIVVPRWFLTDLASIPKGFRWLISVNEKHRDWALCHDVWYAFGVAMGWDKDCGDLIFRDGLIVSDIKRWKRKAMYQAVHWFGEPSWAAKEPKYCDYSMKPIYAERYAHLLHLDMDNGAPMLLDAV